MSHVSQQAEPCQFAILGGMRHAALMTMLDLGPERPGQASETRQWGDEGRADHEPKPHLSNRFFGITVALIVVAVVVFLVLRG
jgi:hypothetical protein